MRDARTKTERKIDFPATTLTLKVPKEGNVPKNLGVLIIQNGLSISNPFQNKNYCKLASHQPIEVDPATCPPKLAGPRHGIGCRSVLVMIHHAAEVGHHRLLYNNSPRSNGVSQVPGKWELGQK